MDEAQKVSYEFGDATNPLPLRCIEVPREVTQVEGCDCGGGDWHRAADWRGPGCSIWRLPPEQAQASADDAKARERAFTAELNARLRQELAR